MKSLPFSYRHGPRFGESSARIPGIILFGYYGKANFGDDVLLKVTHSIMRLQAPEVTITVVVDGNDGGYVAAMLDDVEIIAPGTRGHYDMIVHGGGGVFFDFARHGMTDRLLERSIRLIGLRSFVRLEHFARTFLNRPRLSADARIGLGIGVGTFTPGSPKLRQDLPILADFDSLWLRDPQSVDNLRRFGLTSPVILGSDLAFLTEHWCPTIPEGRPPISRAGRPKLGVILRDWPPGQGEGFATSLLPALEQLKTHYEITGLVFDERSDPRTIAALAPFPLRVWKPRAMSISDFADVLEIQDVLLTSRAHGAICGACLGVPSVIVEIEPKLRGVHKMLQQCTQIVLPDRIDTWEEAIAQAAMTPRTSIVADVERNRRLSSEALSETFSTARGAE